MYNISVTQFTSQNLLVKYINLMFNFLLDNFLSNEQNKTLNRWKIVD